MFVMRLPGLMLLFVGFIGLLFAGTLVMAIGAPLALGLFAAWILRRPLCVLGIRAVRRAR